MARRVNICRNYIYTALKTHPASLRPFTAIPALFLVIPATSVIPVQKASKNGMMFFFRPFGTDSLEKLFTQGIASLALGHILLRLQCYGSCLKLRVCFWEGPLLRNDGMELKHKGFVSRQYNPPSLAKMLY